MASSKIEWTDRSDWNPIRGCTRVSPGCGGPGPHGGCYAEAMAARFSKPGMWGHGFAEMQDGKPRWTGKVELQEDRLSIPLSWRKPARVFASSTSDVFHEALAEYEIAQIFGVMTCAAQHTYQVLTKRSERMVTLLNDEGFWEQVNCFSEEYAFEHSDSLARRSDDYRAISNDHSPSEPPGNIWLGVSCERQQEADERIPDLLQTSAAVRFISAEPLLGPIDIRQYTNGVRGSYLDWVIVGGESGKNARPMHPDWARSLRDQCTAPGVAFFFKQWGEWAPTMPVESGTPGQFALSSGDEHWSFFDESPRHMMRFGATGRMRFVGKQAAGRTLDGREWNEFPQQKELE